MKTNKNINLIMIFVLTLVLSTVNQQLSAYAQSEGQERSSIALTVVVPQPEENFLTDNREEPEQHPLIRRVYPVQVWESRDNGRREITRVYELRENEDSANISRTPFERDGFRFELGEIVRREISGHSTIEHTETVTVTTQTNDLATILQLLSPTLEHMTEDGYFGMLTLDISSIEIESQGTRSSSHTATRTREFPHLSGTDTSLVPRSITENGNTYNLADVNWRTQSSTAIDYRQLPATFTAVATYTRIATRTSTIGYTTTALYRGQLSKISVGKTEFTVNFIGIPIVTPIVAVQENQSHNIVEEPTQNHIPATSSERQAYINNTLPEYETSAQPDESYNLVKEAEELSERQSTGMPMPIAILLIILCSTLAYFVGKKGKSLLENIKVLKKTACLLLCSAFVLGTVQTAYASEFPRQALSRENMYVMHFNPQHNSCGSDSLPRASPTGYFAPNPAASIYNYGDFLGTLAVERLNRRVRVYGGATMSAMDYGAGHFSFSGLNSGNTILIGHNRGRGNGFFDFVKLLEYGDIVTLEAGGITRSYAVAMRYIVEETDFSLLTHFESNRLTLVTCLEYRGNKRRIAVLLEI